MKILIIFVLTAVFAVNNLTAKTSPSEFFVFSVRDYMLPQPVSDVYKLYLGRNIRTMLADKNNDIYCFYSKNAYKAVFFLNQSDSGFVTTRVSVLSGSKARWRSSTSITSGYLTFYNEYTDFNTVSLKTDDQSDGDEEVSIDATVISFFNGRLFDSSFDAGGEFDFESTKKVKIFQKKGKTPPFKKGVFRCFIGSARINYGGLWEN